MFSIKKNFVTKIATLIKSKYLFFFVLILFFSYSEASNTNLKIREFKFYREILFNNYSVFLNKKNNDFYLKKNNLSFKLNNKNNSKFYFYEKNENGKSHYLASMVSSVKKNQIGYFMRSHIMQFKSEICDAKSDYSKNIEKVISPDLISKIQSLEVVNLFDKETCGAMSKERFEEFKEILIDILSYKRGELKECIDSEEAQKIISEDAGLMQNATDVFGRYFSLIENMQSSGIQLKCGLSKENNNKVASFSESPLAIALNIIDNKFNLNIQNIESVLNHELMHASMPQFKNQQNSTCLDEGFVKLFEYVCKYNSKSGFKKPPHSSAVVNSCLKGQEFDIEKIDLGNDNKGVGDEASVAGAVAMSSLENREQSKQVTEQVVATMNSGSAQDFVPVPDSTVQLVATAPVMTASGKPLSAYEGDGQFHTVVADSGFMNSVRQLGDSLGSSMNNADRLLTSALGNTGMAAAATAVGSRAIASTGGAATTGSAGASASGGSTSSGAYAPMTASEIFMNRYYPDSPEVQKAMSNPKLDTMNYDQKEAYYRSLGKASSAAASAVEAAGAAKAASSGASNKVGAVSKTSPAASSGAAAGAIAVSANKNATSAPSAVAAASGARGIASVGDATPVAVSTSASTEINKEIPTAESDQPAALKPLIRNIPSSSRGPASVPAVAATNSSTRLDNVIIDRLSSSSAVNEPAYSRVMPRFSDESFQKQADAKKILILDAKTGAPLWKSSVKPERCLQNNSETKTLKAVACK